MDAIVMQELTDNIAEGECSWGMESLILVAHSFWNLILKFLKLASNLDGVPDISLILTWKLPKEIESATVPFNLYVFRD